MKNQAYYVAKGVEVGEINAGSIACDTSPIVVNCAGLFDTKHDFVTDNKNGRKDYYLMYITKGKLSVSMPDGEHCVSSGDVVIFPPEYAYRYSYNGSGEGLSYMWVHFTGSHALFYLSTFGFDSLPVIHTSSRAEQVTKGFREMFEIFSAEEEFYEHALASPLLKILSFLPNVDRKKHQISKSLAYINASYTEDIQIPVLAQMENLSNSRYHTIFSSVVGMPPKKYIITLRMRHACELLCTTDLPIKQISSIVGYPESQFFCKIFISYMGCSPSDYRKNK